jgi:hypothetical protein
MWSPKTNYPICLIGLILTLVFLPKIASAQTVTGTLRGTVSDSKGAVVPGADVVIRNMETGQERTLKTGSEGGWSRVQQGDAGKHRAWSEPNTRRQL